jgi:rhodanese-related sulfurtransferase
MKSLFFSLASLLMAANALYGHNEPKAAPYKEVTTQQLKEWIDSNKKMVIIDARSDAYDDGERIPGAKQVPVDSTKEEIKAAIPALDTIVVVYCSSHECPASKWLASRLVEMGYTAIYKYPDGIYGWKESGYKTEKAPAKKS